MHTIVTRRKIQTRSCGSNLRMRSERHDTETRGPQGLGKGDVRGVVEVVLGENLPNLTRREEVALRRGSKLEVAQDTVYISRPERSWIRPWRWCRRRQQRSCWGGIYVHPEEEILHALRARTRSLPNTCQTTRATCHERQATSAPLWPSVVGGRRPPPFLLQGSFPPLQLPCNDTVDKKKKLRLSRTELLMHKIRGPPAGL
jgi:hypothetical protein